VSHETQRGASSKGSGSNVIDSGMIGNSQSGSGSWIGGCIDVGMEALDSGVFDQNQSQFLSAIYVLLGNKMEKIGKIIKNARVFFQKRFDFIVLFCTLFFRNIPVLFWFSENLPSTQKPRPV